jgi:prolyl-tRNA editing enzyme YbaK/EbsC (Cys-tRNA(Pro) deacylase)
MSLVTEYLRFRDVSFQTVFHRQTPTSAEEARAIGVPTDEVLKTVIIDSKGGHALAVIPASRRLDLRLVRAALGDPHAHLASEAELRHDFRGYDLGAMHPLGVLVGCPTLVDPEVLGHHAVLFAAGTRTESVKANPTELFRDEPLTVVHLTLRTEHDRDPMLAAVGRARP